MSNTEETKNYVASIHNAFAGAIGEELRFLKEKRDEATMPVDIAMFTRAIADLKLRVVEAALPAAHRMMVPPSVTEDVAQNENLTANRVELLSKLKKAQQGGEEQQNAEHGIISEATEGSE